MDPVPATRQCGRCRKVFDGDPDLAPGTQPSWWLCPSCHATLLGPSGPRPTEPRPV